MDSRFPTYYLTDRRVMRCTPEQFRFFVLATAWSVSNMTDGRIEKADLYLIPFASEDEPEALVQKELWTQTENGWLITDFQKTQSSAAQLEAALLNRRENERKRQQKKREAEKGESRELSRDSHVTEAKKGQEVQMTRDGHVTSEGKAEAEVRKGKASFYEGIPSTETVSDYPTDPVGIDYRQKIEENNIRSVDDLISAHPMTLAQAEKIWSLAYPSKTRRAA